MLTFNVISSEDESRISGIVDNDTFNVPYSDESKESLMDFQDKHGELETYEEYESWVQDVKSFLDGISQGDVIETKSKDLMYDSSTGKYHLKVGKKVSKFAVPDRLVAVILESVEKGISPEPVVKAWARFLRNPNFTVSKAAKFAEYITATIVDFDEVERLVTEEGYTRAKAQAAAEYNDVAITQEGLIVTKKYAELLTKGYKIDPKTNEVVYGDLYEVDKTVDTQTGEVEESVKLPEFAEELLFQPPVMGTGGNAFECGKDDSFEKGHIIKVGMVHRLDSWDKVDTNDNRSCVPGLHVGGWKYVGVYGGLGCQLLECLVDPAEIGAICDVSAGSDGAMRVKEYFIYGAVKGRTKGIYHSSKYAAIKDAEWDKFKAEAIKESEEAAKSIVGDIIDVN